MFWPINNNSTVKGKIDCGGAVARGSLTVCHEAYLRFKLGRFKSLANLKMEAI
jgi:hypothetical protein